MDRLLPGYDVGRDGGDAVGVGQGPVLPDGVGIPPAVERLAGAVRVQTHADAEVDEGVDLAQVLPALEEGREERLEQRALPSWALPWCNSWRTRKVLVCRTASKSYARPTRAPVLTTCLILMLGPGLPSG